jgi:hypothetical protein
MDREQSPSLTHQKWRSLKAMRLSFHIALALSHLAAQMQLSVAHHLQNWRELRRKRHD